MAYHSMQIKPTSNMMTPMITAKPTMIPTDSPAINNTFKLFK